MAMPLSYGDADAGFTSWQCHRSRGPRSPRVQANGVERSTARLPSIGSPLSDFEAIIGRYPVYRIDPS